MPKIRYTLESVPAGQFFDSPEHPGVTFYKFEKADCRAVRFETKRPWVIVAQDRTEEEGRGTLNIIFRQIPAESLSLGHEAQIVHPGAFVAKTRRIKLMLMAGRSMMHEIHREWTPPTDGLKPGLARLLNGHASQ